jgi:hypothetical protein
MLFCVLLSGHAVASPLAYDNESIKGEWAGRSTLVDGSVVSKAVLFLGIEGAADSKLRFEGVSNCLLNGGIYQSDQQSGWILSFPANAAKGSCKRMQESQFHIRQTRPGRLEMDVMYAGADGKTDRRVAALARYP